MYMYRERYMDIHKHMHICRYTCIYITNNNTHNQHLIRDLVRLFDMLVCSARTISSYHAVDSCDSRALKQRLVE